MIAMGAVPSRSGFLSSFWGLVPLHGLHVSVRCLWIIIMLVQMWTFGMAPVVKTRLLRLGIFWHFLDLVWVGIFTIVYLAGLGIGTISILAVTFAATSADSAWPLS